MHQRTNDATAVRIVEAIAQERDIEPTELDYRLYDYIETDGLGLLTNRDTDSWTLSFECPDGTVTVTGEGEIHLDLSDGGESTTQSPAGD